MQGKFHPHFIFALSGLLLEGKFKAGLIEFYMKDYIRKGESGQIQD